MRYCERGACVERASWRLKNARGGMWREDGKTIPAALCKRHFQEIADDHFGDKYSYERIEATKCSDIAEK